MLAGVLHSWQIHPSQTGLRVDARLIITTRDGPVCMSLWPNELCWQVSAFLAGWSIPDRAKRQTKNHHSWASLYVPVTQWAMLAVVLHSWQVHPSQTGLRVGARGRIITYGGPVCMSLDPVSYAGWSLAFLQGSPILARSEERRQGLTGRQLFIHISVTHSDSLPPSIIWGPEKNTFLGKA